MSKTFHFKSFSIKRAGVSIDIDMSRIEQNVNDAQRVLDSAIMTSMLPFMPMDTGQFINTTTAMSAALEGNGKVIAAAPPYGRYLYEGKKMVDSKTGKGPYKIPDEYGGYVLRFRKGAKLKKTGVPLKYSRGSARPHWFDEAKAKDGDNWVDLVQREINKG